MSDALYSTRLTWQGSRGHFAWSGVHIDLRQCPPILALMGWTSVEYTPGLHIHRCQPLAYGERDMTHEEVGAVRAWLQAKAADVLVVVTKECR